MKKIILGIIAVLTITSLVACGNDKKESTNVETNDINTNVNSEINEVKLDTNTNAEAETEKLTDEEMYGTLISDYNKALSEYDLDDLDVDEKITNKYNLVSSTLLMHIARYANNGVELTTSYYDIDKNGINELLVGASGSLGAIYSYDENTKKPVKIFFQDTLERGNLSIYDNGVIFSEGSGGAALHYYEFGQIGTDGISYQLAESIEEEYIAENETPVYRNSETGEELSYKSLDEIMNKYVADTDLI